MWMPRLSQWMISSPEMANNNAETISPAHAPGALHLRQRMPPQNAMPKNATSDHDRRMIATTEVK